MKTSLTYRWPPGSVAELACPLKAELTRIGESARVHGDKPPAALECGRGAHVCASLK